MVVRIYQFIPVSNEHIYLIFLIINVFLSFLIPPFLYPTRNLDTPALRLCLLHHTYHVVYFEETLLH